MPLPTWLVDGIVPSGSIGQLYGRSGHFKSFVALDLALSVATGLPWMGYTVEAGPAVYIAGEGARGLIRRIHAWKCYRGLTDTDLDGFRLLDSPVQLGVRQDVSDIQREITNAFSRQPALIVFDTQARCTVGVEENSNTDMMRVIHNLSSLRQATDSTVLLIHHVGRSGTEDRGASAVRGALDFQIYQQMAGRAEAVVRLTCRKQKDWREFTPIGVKLTEYGDSLVPIPHGLKESDAKPTNLTESELEALTTLQGQSNGLSSPEWWKASGLKKSTFYKVRNSLAEAGHVILVDGLYRTTNSSESEDARGSTPATPRKVHRVHTPHGGGRVDITEYEEVSFETPEEWAQFFEQIERQVSEEMQVEEVAFGEFDVRP